MGSEKALREKLDPDNAIESICRLILFERNNFVCGKGWRTIPYLRKFTVVMHYPFGRFWTNKASSLKN
jgi:hypothetical protein